MFVDEISYLSIQYVFVQMSDRFKLSVVLIKKNIAFTMFTMILYHIIRLFFQNDYYFVNTYYFKTRYKR